MPIGTKIIKRLVSNGNGTEYAYFTEDMLDDSLAIREIQFNSDEGVPRTLVSLRCDAGEHTEEFHLYYGTYLAPVQVYRIARDVLDLYNFYILEDFFEVVEENLTIERYNTKDFRNPTTAKKMDDDIKQFFARLQAD